MTIRHACALALCCLAAAAFQPAHADEPPRIVSAMSEYERNHWQAAYATLAALADAGNAQAARIALLMARHGRTLYGQDFGASTSRIEQWAALIRTAAVETPDADLLAHAAPTAAGPSAAACACPP